MIFDKNHSPRTGPWLKQDRAGLATATRERNMTGSFKAAYSHKGGKTCTACDPSQEIHRDDRE